MLYLQDHSDGDCDFAITMFPHRGLCLSQHSFLANGLDFGIIPWSSTILQIRQLQILVSGFMKDVVYVPPVLRTSPPWVAASHHINSKEGRLRHTLHQIWEERTLVRPLQVNQWILYWTPVDKHGFLISGFCHTVNEIFAVLGCYTALIGS